MDREGHDDRDSISDASCESLYEVHVDLGAQGSDSAAGDPHGQQLNEVNSQFPLGLEGAQPLSNSMLTMSAEQFQEMVIRALFQSTASLVGPSSGVLHHAGEEAAGFHSISSANPGSSTTWSEASYHKAEARRLKTQDVMRTSAGEESDSQVSFPLPENATVEQRALRTRRLNRWRAKKARDLTSNRKALKKSPYIIHVDGTSKPKGIHKHQWKAAVRGQCTRLDPSMDNINHHPKTVVDSIWHALEKEWEFQGFAHKAREMFERTATKFMRNRKMHLKHKCQRDVDGPTPNDVNARHWAKIVELTKKSMKQEPTVTYAETSSRGKDMSTVNVLGKSQSSRQYPGVHGETVYKSSEGHVKPGDSVAAKGEQVDAQIQYLRNQLLQLENARKARDGFVDGRHEVSVQVTGNWAPPSNVCGAADLKAFKENMPPSDSTTEIESNFFSKTSTRREGKAALAEASEMDIYRNSSRGKEREGRRKSLQEITDLNREEVISGEMECGDVVSIVAVVQGKEEDVGEGVLMGFGGSKYARKIVPKGWCTVKVNSCTPSGGLEMCPFPSGWKDQVKERTVKDEVGRLILWPLHLVHT